MYLQNKLLAKKQSYELALQAALKDWPRDPVEFKCPACGSKKVATRPDLRGKNPCVCTTCKHHFDQPIHFVCDCPEPGTGSQCHDCPNFRKLLATVRAIAEDVQSHPLHQNQLGSNS